QCGIDPPRARGGGRRRSHHRRRPRPPLGVRRRPHVGQRPAPLGPRVTSARTGFVTGGSRGIGRACAVALAEAGHRVAFCYSSDHEGAKETQAAIEDAGSDALAIRTDVGDPAAVDQVFGEIEDSLGPVELLVNNAGIAADGLVMRMTDEQWDVVLRTNLTGAFHTIRRATPKMMR